MPHSKFLLVYKIDQLYVDRNFSEKISYNVRYGEIDVKYMIEVSNIYGEVDLKGLFNKAQDHIRNCPGELESLIPEISFDCSSRMIIVTLSFPVPGQKRQRTNDNLMRETKRMKVDTPQRFEKIVRYIKKEDGTFVPMPNNDLL